MLFNTIEYLLFLLIVVVIYYALPKRVRHIWLLGASYYFYMQWNAVYILLIFSCTLITYFGGRVLGSLENRQIKVPDRNEVRNKRKLCIMICIMLNIGVLGFFKYFEFAVHSLNHLLMLVSLQELNWSYDILLPVGISFYTLQSIGYLIDVYRGEIEEEKNFIRYALFISFFPQLVAGPIERSQNLLKQLHTFSTFRYENLRRGALLILYGLFLKMVIADRAAILVDTVYRNSADYPGFYIVVATVFFAIQIYCDFYGYSTIARGSALLMGISLMDNFNAPYYARSVQEFWRRWHISLSGWFRDYLYIPLGGNRKGKIRKECNLLIVFTVSGLWHGASFAFLLWGLLNGIYQVIGNIIAEIKKSVKKLLFPNSGGEGTDFSADVLKTLGTFGLVTFAWLFFRAGGLHEASDVLKNMICYNNLHIFFDGSLYQLGINETYMRALLGAIVVLFVVDYFKYCGKDVAGIFLKQGWWFRALVIMFLVFAILLYGCYGSLYDTQQFIYFQF